jgi:hypothetical protein
LIISFRERRLRSSKDDADRDLGGKGQFPAAAERFEELYEIERNVRRAGCMLLLRLQQGSFRIEYREIPSRRQYSGCGQALPLIGDVSEYHGRQLDNEASQPRVLLK